MPWAAVQTPSASLVQQQVSDEKFQLAVGVGESALTLFYETTALGVSALLLKYHGLIIPTEYTLFQKVDVWKV